MLPKFAIAQPLTRAAAAAINAMACRKQFLPIACSYWQSHYSASWKCSVHLKLRGKHRLEWVKFGCDGSHGISSVV
jgi:hypothetical protein